MKIVQRFIAWLNPDCLIKEDPPYNPDCHGSIDMYGRFFLKYKDEAAIRKHFKRQFDAAERLGKLLDKTNSR